jgi:FkbM family methyltransferase
MMNTAIEDALEKAGENLEMRALIFAELAEAEKHSQQPAQFRREVRWPIVQALIGRNSHLLKLKNGLIFEIWTQSRIEEALLLSLDETPDHIWEPQTTKLACILAKDCANVVVGGAYIGDQVLLVAKALQSNGKGGCVYAFEPSSLAIGQLAHNIEINELQNVKAERLALWDQAGVEIQFQGAPALVSAFTETEQQDETAFKVLTTTIDEYAKEHGVSNVGLIMLDTEEAEIQALSGAQSLIGKKCSEAPHIIFEVHSDHVHSSAKIENVSTVRFLLSLGYEIFAIRDLHGNLSMEKRAIEIIPLQDIYVPEAPHCFNMLATKDKDLASKYGLTIVRNVSAKLLSEKNIYLSYPPKDPSLHLPLDGLGLELF